MNQSTQIALATSSDNSLASINSKTPSLGQQLAAASQPVVLTAAQITTLTPLTTVATTQSGPWTVTANAGTNLNTSLLALDSTVAKDSTLGTINTSVNTLLKPASTLAALTNLVQMNGQAIQMGSGIRTVGTQRVTIATDDLVPISGTITANLGTIAGAATAANQTTANTSLASIDSKLTSPISVSQNTVPWIVAGQIAVGSVPVNPPVSISGVDGGGLKRHILTDTSGRIEIDTVQSLPLPSNASTSTLQTTGNASLTSIDSKLTSPITVSPRVALTGAGPTSANVGVASAQVVAANGTRKGLVLTNLSGSKNISIAFGATAVFGAGITLQPGTVFVMDAFTFSTQAINAISDAAAQPLSIQEFN